MRGGWRWVRREPWMALNASVATLCAATVVAIRWLAVLGVVRDFAVTRTSGTFPGAGGGFGFTTSTFHRQLGFVLGPSRALTQVDRLAWWIGLVAGLFWILRLGVRSADRRIGGLRTLGVGLGFGLFVATGVMHSIADAVYSGTRARNRADRLIRLWCSVAVVSAVVVGLTISVGAHADATAPGDTAVLAPLGWSIARNALQLAVALGGWCIAALLTRHWIAGRTTARHPDRASATID